MAAFFFARIGVLQQLFRWAWVWAFRPKSVSSLTPFRSGQHSWKAPLKQKKEFLYEEHGSDFVARRECGAFWLRIQFEFWWERQYQWNLERDPKQFGE